MIVLGTVALFPALVGVVAHHRAPRSLAGLLLSSVAHYGMPAAPVAAALFAHDGSPLGWTGCAASVAVLVWAVAQQAPARVADAVPADGTDIVVMTANLHLGEGDPEAVVAAVRAFDVDVLMVQELTLECRAALRSAGLDEQLPSHVVDALDGGTGTGLWSRFAMRGPVVRRDLGFSYVAGQAELPGVPGTTSLASVHTFGPAPRPNFTPWNRDMAAYRDILDQLPGATALVGGDFNATRGTAQFRRLLGRRFADAATQAGTGYAPTWPADRTYPPLITIDHVLTDGAVATSARTVDIAGTDHRALVVTARMGGSAGEQRATTLLPNLRKGVETPIQSERGSRTQSLRTGRRSAAA